MNTNNEFKERFKRKIYKFVLQLIGFTDALPNDQICRVVGNQLMRSGTSVGGNYFEVQAASSRKDFTNYFNHSLKSANESKFWMNVLKDTHKANPSEVDALLDEITEISKIFATSILTLKKRR